MDKHQLAGQLRQRQRDMGGVERRLIDSLPDDTIIDCYIACSCCGERQVKGSRLVAAIARADDVEDFFRICNEAASNKHAHRGNEERPR